MSVGDDIADSDKAMSLLALITALECLLRLQCTLSELFPVQRVLEKLLPFAECGERHIISLRILDIFFSGETLKHWAVDEADKLIDQLHESLVRNLSNPHHQVSSLLFFFFFLKPRSFFILLGVVSVHFRS